MQGGFLLKTQARNPRDRMVLQTSKLIPSFVRIRRETGRTNVGGLVFINSEDTGRVDRNTIELFNVQGHGFRFKATAEGVKAVVRRLRPQEAQQLEETDQAIREAEDRLRSLKLQRRAFLKEAFDRGHVVTVSEIKAAADGPPMEETVELS